jgi:hypothetical protein
MMDVLSKVSNGLYNVMDWAMEGSMPWALTKITGLVVGATAVLMSPFMFIAHQNAEALNDRIDYLNNTATKVFNSVSDCVSQGYYQEECTASQREAYDIAGNLGTTVSYSSQSDCLINHETCEKVTTPITTYTKVGDVSVPNTTYVTNYHPPVVAWQAAAYDLQEAVPLYKTPEENVAVRFDGTEFSLDAR